MHTNTNLKKIIKIIIIIILVPLVLFLLFLGYSTIVDYNPDDIVEIDINSNSSLIAGDSETFTFLNWNIGYAGLGKDMTFFMDGGTDVRSSKEVTNRNFDSIKKVINQYKSDFYLIQELDYKSRRTYGLNQYEGIQNILDNYNSTFAINYKVWFVPSPIKNPYGKVHAGIGFYSKYKINKSLRYQLPGSYGWPVQLYFLDRCMSLNEVPLKNGKKLIIINTHNSAYDKGGNQKAAQLAFIKEILEQEYKKGNYVIIGGDWNNLLPGVTEDYFKTKLKVPDFYVPIDKNFTPKGWTWGIDNTIPTNRTLDIKYQKGVNYVTVIDGFLCSPNIDIIEVKNIDLGFKNSDHNPVYMKIGIKN